MMDYAIVLYAFLSIQISLAIVLYIGLTILLVSAWVCDRKSAGEGF